MARQTASEYVSPIACGSKPDSATGNATCSTFCMSAARGPSGHTTASATSAANARRPGFTRRPAALRAVGPVRPQSGPARSWRAEKLPQARDALVETRIGCREAPAHEAFALRAERAPRCESEPRFLHQAPAERHAVAHARDAEERVHRARGLRDVDARQHAEGVHQPIAGTSQALARRIDGRLAV